MNDTFAKLDMKISGKMKRWSIPAIRLSFGVYIYLVWFTKAIGTFYCRRPALSNGKMVALRGSNYLVKK
jgi:hypothetical protein